jgi:ATP phosphoribosyltransferase
MLTLHCPPGRVHALATYLRDRGAETVTVTDLNYVFTRDNSLYTRLEKSLEVNRRVG